MATTAIERGIAAASHHPRGNSSLFATALNFRAMPAVHRGPATVTFFLDGSHHRQRLLQQVLWMRLEGLSISRIARESGLNRETVQELIDVWQRQTAMVFSEPFSPLAVCPRRESGRNRSAKRLGQVRCPKR